MPLFSAMHKKLQVGLLFGGKSAEHEISLLSARNVYEAMDRSKYEPWLIGIDKDGRWSVRNESVFLKESQGQTLPALERVADQVVLVAGDGAWDVVSLSAGRVVHTVDVVFPILHGTYGEDGTVQGLLQLVGIPYVGSGVLASALGMDKEVTKKLLRDAGIDVVRFVCARAHAKEAFNGEWVGRELGWPLFVKPANLGSSVGISKVHNLQELKAALTLAFSFDTKVLIEEAVVGRELECAVLGNEEPQASSVGEIVPHPKHGFYSYEAKYLDKQGAKILVPAPDLSESVISKVRNLAVRAFQVLGCEGMARVDFFLCADGRLLVNEINTIPGFTAISMYPKLWQASGMSYGELIDRLIQLALARASRHRALRTSY